MAWSTADQAIEAALKGSLSVKVAGVKGNETDDDSTNILDAANLLVSLGGANLVFPPGTYRIAQDITLPAGITLHFTQGAVLDPDTGVTVTIESQVMAGKYAIFGGGGIVIDSITSRQVDPVWWTIPPTIPPVSGKHFVGKVWLNSSISPGGSMGYACTTEGTANGTIWVASTNYAVGDTVNNSGNVYQCTTAGTSAASGGPTGTGTSITDGTVVWAYIDTLALYYPFGLISTTTP